MGQRKMADATTEKQDTAWLQMSIMRPPWSSNRPTSVNSRVVIPARRVPNFLKGTSIAFSDPKP